MGERTVQFKLLLSVEERQWLEDLATRRGLTATDVIRQFIREDHQKAQQALHVKAS